MNEDLLHIGPWTFHSRLIMGTGRHRNDPELVASLGASGAEVVTVAIRRLDLDNPSRKTILDSIDPNRYMVLPNTAGCRTPEEALMVAQLARSLGFPRGSSWRSSPTPGIYSPTPSEPSTRQSGSSRRGSRCCPTSMQTQYWQSG